MTRFNWLANILLMLILALFLLDITSLFEVKNEWLKKVVYYTILLSPIILIWILFAVKTILAKGVSSIVPIVAIVLMLFLSPMRILFLSSPWETHKIIYENKHSDFKKVEFQMQDIGALGYNKRTVEVTYVTKMFMLVSPVEKDIDNSEEWVKIN